MSKKPLRVFYVALIVWVIVFAILFICTVGAEGGLTIIGDGVLIDAVAFSNGDTLAVLTNKYQQIIFVYTYLDGGSVRDLFRVGLTPLVFSKLIVSGRWAHLAASGVGVSYQFSYKLPEDAPWFNCPTQHLPIVRN